MSNGTITMTGAEYDALAGKIAALEAELAKLRAGGEPVAAQVRFRRPEKGLADWSVWQQTTIKPNMPAWSIDSAGYEVEYRLLYTTPQPSAVPDGWRELLQEVAEYAPPYGTIVAMTSQMALGSKARRLLAAAPSAPATVQGDGWIPVSERLPESERTVLAFYLNSHGKGRRVRAEYIAAKTKSADDGWDSDEPADYDEQADEYFWPAGWYEVMDNWDDLTHMVIHEGEVTHWMPLPAAPGAAQRAIAELREECERLRSECARLESKYERDVWGLNNEGDPIGGDPAGGFANDLFRVTAERDTLRQQRDKLAGLLADVKADYTHAINWEDMRAIMKRIDAALAEVNK